VLKTLISSLDEKKNWNGCVFWIGHHEKKSQKRIKRELINMKTRSKKKAAEKESKQDQPASLWNPLTISYFFSLSLLDLGTSFLSILATHGPLLAAILLGSSFLPSEYWILAKQYGYWTILGIASSVGLGTGTYFLE
jgi:hypothetical protein